jgi:hypothetical protein
MINIFFFKKKKSKGNKRSSKGGKGSNFLPCDEGAERITKADIFLTGPQHNLKANSRIL